MLKNLILTFLGVIIHVSLSAQVWTQLGSDLIGHAQWQYAWSPVSLSSDGTTISVGGPYNNAGQVRTYKYISGAWTQVGSDIDGEAAADNSGQFLSTSSNGNIVAIGAPFNDATSAGNAQYGHVRVYENISGTWTQIGSDIDGEDEFDYSGWSVSLNSDGTTVAIGANGNDGNGTYSGHVIIYENISGTWTQVGADIDGDTALDQSGYSVSLSSDGNTVAIGAIWNGGNGTKSGHVKIYKNISGTWTQVGADIDGENAGDESGFRVSLSSDASIVAIGAPLNDGNGTNSGHVKIYKNISGTWTQIGADIDGENAGDESGCAVSLSSDGSIVAIGARYNIGDSATASHHGHVRIYKNISGTWTQIGADINGSNLEGQFGFSVSLSGNGDTIAIGANPGYTRVYFLCETESSIDTITSCAPYVWTNGISYFNSDTSATDTFENTAGCDSIVTLNLTILHESNDTLIISECDSYTSPSGVTYTISNIITDTFVNAAGCDSIVTLNLTINNSTKGTDVQTACNSYTWIDGITYITSNNMATDTLTNAAGCDSIVTLSLTVIETDKLISNQPIGQSVDINRSTNFIVISGYDSVATYQWQLDDGAGFKSLSNTGQYSGVLTDTLLVSNVTLLNGGEIFRCLVTVNDCSDTSETALLTIGKADVSERFLTRDYTVYPNPSKGIVFISTEASLFGASYTVYSNSGALIRNGSITSEITTLDIQNFAEGVYLIIIDGSTKQTFRVIKK